MATNYSQFGGSKAARERAARRVRCGWMLGWCIGAVFWAGSLRAADPSADAIHAREVKRAEGAYTAARARWQADTNNLEAQWHYGRACYDWADCATSSSQRASIAQEGITACREAVARASNSVPAHYYLALNLSQMARTKTVGALKLVSEMEREFLVAAGLDAAYDYAGADRGAGILYSEAPGWPISIGSRGKARTHLQQALKLSPGYPDNPLNLAEAELKWGDREGAARELKALDQIWDAARKQFTGEEWETSWADWGRRREDLRQKLSASSKPAANRRN